MSDPTENFESIFKKSDEKKFKSLYSVSKQQNQNNLKPQDVISSVFNQLKAIQSADSMNNKKSVNKNLQKFKKSNFLSVNNLPVYEEAPKPSTKFDTQCVSDTQLINLIEDAEILEGPRGMTQEFETTFCHYTEKDNLIDKVSIEKGKDMKEENKDKVNDNITEETGVVNKENNEEIDMNLSVISPIMCSNNVLDTNSQTDTQDNKTKHTLDEEFIPKLDDIIETDIDKSIERPLSPIIFHKNIKLKSKTPSPLVFSLDKFEQFEMIAVPILERDNDLSTVKHVINSQILNKELHIQIDENKQTDERQFSPVFENKDFKEHNVKDDKTEFKTHTIKRLDSDTDLEFIQLDKATSDDLIKKVMNEDFEKLSTKESEILKDEILFSSDEEDNYVHKSYQDLPFTCALETSFYNQSDVLDKTMYVGFQTASNKSIQIFTESFSHAKSILSDEITVTDLVNNCEKEKNKELADIDDEAKLDLDGDEKEFNLGQTEIKPGNNIKATEDEEQNSKKFEGFMTASNKEIRLSQKALARCKKVFQDIDLNDDFDEEYLEEEIAKDKDKINVVNNSPSREISKTTEEDIQNIDDVIIQEFENIEMSLKEDKEPDKNMTNIGFKTASNKYIKISDTALSKIKDIFKDIDFEEDLNEDITEIKYLKTKEDQELSNSLVNKNFVGFKTASNKNINISKEALTKTKSIFDNIDTVNFPNKANQRLEKENQIAHDYEQPSTSKAVFVGFKTANNKNIKISDQALAKTKNIFKDLDTVELPKKIKKDTQDNTNENNTIIEHKNNKTGVVDNNIRNNDNPIDAIDDNDNLFDGIHSQEFQEPMEIDTFAPNKDSSDLNEGYADLNGPSTSKCNFVGFKTANNKNIEISAAALLKTKNIFKDIDAEDFKFPDKSKGTDKKMTSEADKEDTAHTNVELNVGGFKTASNKSIKISDTALAKTKNIFQDLESDDFKFPPKKNISERTMECDKRDKDENKDFSKPSTSIETFVGFKTANNRKIAISKEALAKTKNIFNDIDEVKFPEKPDKDSKTVKPIETNKTNELGDFNKPSTSKAPFTGFKTANNKNIAISEESLAKTRNIFQDIDATDVNIPEGDTKNVFTEKEDINIELNKPSTSKASFVGFKTANNRNINISKQALEKTKNIFKDIDTNDFRFPKDIGEKSFNEEKSAYPELEDTPSLINKGFVGFKTANNKVINISDTALLKTKDIFKDLGSSDLPTPKKVKKDYPDTEIDGIIQTSKDKDDDNTKFNILETNIPKFQGFQTASNKKVKISTEALIKSRKMFQDIDNTEEFNSKENNTNFDLQKDTFNANIEKNDDKLDINRKSSPIFKGFQTGNKKPVKISKEALAKSRKLFENVNTDNDIEPPFHGFPSTNYKVDTIKDLVEASTSFDSNKKTNNNFKGFQTASDKEVAISSEALVKSKKVFQDFDNNDLNKEATTTNIKFVFKTGTNRDIKVSDEALVRTKRLFSDIDDVKDSLKNKDINEVNISDIINTQVLNNFDESLHTEDFLENQVKSKRSGSPILSCPRAKRRKKFEIPYSQKVKEPEIIKVPSQLKDVNKIIFTKDYKKNKVLKLKDLAKLTDNKHKIDTYLFDFSFENLLDFKFDKNRNDVTNDVMSIEKLKELFQNSVNEKLIPKGWLDNHIKLILWKLISYEVKFKFFGVCNARNVIDQLKYRYDKELYEAQRSALRKIFEKDDVPSKTLVLCVAGIYENGVSVTSPTTNNIELLLSDGWYCIFATIDKMLAQLVCQHKIVVGTKLMTNGAELVNCEQGISPWEDTSLVRLKIFGNSTRRARWDARLGYHGNGAMLSQLSSVRVDGGKVGRVRVLVTRVYPALYVEKFDDGSTVTRSERLEHLHQMKSEAERQAVMEKIYEEVEKEFADQESQDSEGYSELNNKRPCLDSGSQIAKLMKTSKDPSEFRAGLTSSQSRLLEAHNCKKREYLLQNIQQKIRDKIEKTGVGGSRNVVTLLKIRVAGVQEKNGVEVAKGMMSIWKPADAVLDIIKEGALIEVLNVVPTAIRYSEIQISAGRQSVFIKSKYKQPENFKPYTNLLKRNCFTIKDLAKNTTIATDYNEIDTVGFIFLIDPSSRDFDSNRQPFQNIFLADTEKNIICINFWGGLKKFGYENVLDTGQIVSCFNLQKRAGNTRKSIPQYRVTEFTYFTKTPKNENARVLLDDLSKKFLSLDRRKFVDDCVVLKNNFAVLKGNNENISPYRINNSDFNISKNKLFIDSPLARPSNIDSNFNLTGLDFESTFKQTDSQNLSEEVLLRKRKVNEKIARLKMYGEPPPLSTIHIINKSKNASNSYKSPLNANNNISKIVTPKNNSNLSNSKSDSCINVASVTETPEKGGNLNESASRSPLLNRTYVKSVNPVKINFDTRDNNDSNVDHFAEEFDGSPPLSLD